MTETLNLAIRVKFPWWSKLLICGATLVAACGVAVSGDWVVRSIMSGVRMDFI